MPFVSSSIISSDRFAGQAPHPGRERREKGVAGNSGRDRISTKAKARLASDSAAVGLVPIALARFSRARGTRVIKVAFTNVTNTRQNYYERPRPRDRGTRAPPPLLVG